MKYAFAALALAATAFAGQWNGTVVYTTDIVTAYTTYCPEATTLSHGTWTYTATASETVTVTDCPCTISKPVTTATPSTVLYTSCPESESYTTPGTSTSAPASSPTWTYSNPLTVSWSSGYSAPVGTGTGVPKPPAATTSLMTANNAGSNKVGAMMVGAVAGVVALAL